MNIVATVVSLSIMGTATPMVMNMAIQPAMAQKRAQNFGIAEAAAVTYAALNEGAPATTPVPDDCDLVELEESNAYSITCVHGEGRFRQSAMRSFRLAILEGGGNTAFAPNREYTPGVYCPLWDAWGINQYNKAHNVQCIPVPYGPWAHTYDGEMLW